MIINIRKNTPKNRGKVITYDIPNDLQDWICDYILDRVDNDGYDVFDEQGLCISGSMISNIIDEWKFGQTFGASTMFQVLCDMKERINVLEDTVRWLKRDLGNIGKSWDEY
jgi:hypothetical protein